jgi:hypothetical protein
MIWAAVLVALAVLATVFAQSRCRKANHLIERILTEELGPAEPVRRPVVAQASHAFRPHVPAQRPAA